MNDEVNLKGKTKTRKQINVLKGAMDQCYYNNSLASTDIAKLAKTVCRGEPLWTDVFKSQVKNHQVLNAAFLDNKFTTANCLPA